MQVIGIALRPAVANDVPFIAQSWLRSYRQNSDYAASVRIDDYMTAHSLIVNDALRRSSITVAHPIGDPELIAGYLVTEHGGAVVHYVYTRAGFRRMGVAKALLAGQHPTVFTHLTKHTERVLTLVPGVRHNPYCMFGTPPR